MLPEWGQPVEKHKLTPFALKSLKPAPKGKTYDVPDSNVPGLSVRVSESGRRTFVLVARYGGSKNPTRRALGVYDVLSLDDAREKAREWLKAVKQGKDPAIEEARQRAAEQRRQADVFSSVAEEFIKRKVSKTRKGVEVARDIRREFGGVDPQSGALVGPWASRPITDISRADVVAVIESIVDRGAPYQARNVLGHARLLFNWAIARDAYGLEMSPCDRIKPKETIGPKKARQRILNDNELRAFWKCAGETAYPYGPMFRLLLVTGQRESMVCEAHRSEFDVSKREWSLSAERMKSDQPFLVPVALLAQTILDSLPKFKSGGFLFSSSHGETPIRGNALSKPKRQLDAAMLAELRRVAEAEGKDPAKIKLEPWKFHDLRRTMRSGLSALPIEEHVRELVIGHVRKGIAGVYDLHAYTDEKRHALEQWEGRLLGIVEPATSNRPTKKTKPSTNNVVHLPARA